MRFRLLEPWRTRLLWLSIGLNLFAVAAMAAPHIWPASFWSASFLHRRPPGPPGLDRIVDRMAVNLPPTDAATFRAAMEKERPWYDMTRKRLEEARDDVARTIAKQPYDPVAVRTALMAMQDRFRESTSRFDDSLIASLATLSPEGRTKLSESVHRGMR